MGQHHHSQLGTTRGWTQDKSKVWCKGKSQGCATAGGANFRGQSLYQSKERGGVTLAEGAGLAPQRRKDRTKAGLPCQESVQRTGIVLVSRKGECKSREGRGHQFQFTTQIPFVLSCRCNEGNNQSAVRTPADSAHCERRPVLLKELLPLLEKPGGGSGAATSAANANGRTEVVARSFATPLEAGPSGGPLIQELSELEAHIAAIKQQLQAAMRRKRELEQLQSHQQGAPSGPPSAHQYALPNPRNQQISTLPQF